MVSERILLASMVTSLIFVGVSCDSGAPPKTPVDLIEDTVQPRSDASLDLVSDLPPPKDTLADIPAEVKDMVSPDADLIVPDDAAGDGDTGGCIDVYPGQVLITEVMVNPVQAAAPQGQWIELYNAGGDVLKMSGWALCDGADQCVDLKLDPADGAGLFPGEYLVLGFEDDVALNGGVEVEKLVSGVEMSTGKLVVKVPASGVTVDAVDWTGGDWPAAPGASMNLDPDKFHILQNDDPQSWCPGTQPYGYGDLGSPGAANQACEPLETCGDVITDDGEDCDDGQNGNPADGCKDDCTFTCSVPAMDCEDVQGDCGVPVCEVGGLGQVCAVQPADDPPQDGNPCTLEVCEEGIPSISNAADGAPCDNAGGAAGDYCVDALCVEPVCGDGIEGPLEACDDGGNDPGDGCAADCSLEECGNGVKDPLEACDDGANGDDGDGCKDNCSFTCKVPAQDCPSQAGDCKAAVCVPQQEGQLCGEVDANDPPNDGNPCTVDICVAGLASHPAKADGTACDNGVSVVGDYCVAGVCLDPVCGDGITGPAEGCDDQNANPCDGCLANCKTFTPTCGDGYTCGVEECDDQNINPCDGCLADCTLFTNTCGDGVECPPEECDDGNLVDDDGCSKQCLDENVQPCPQDMVFVPAAPAQGVPDAFCMDRYEASRTDATAQSMGTNTSVAVSQPGVQPWWENPFTLTKFALFEGACAAAGKRLCNADEWFHSCEGTSPTIYVFGDVFDRDVCNCVDTWCDTYCQANGISPVVDAAGCGYSLYYSHPDMGAPFYPVPTGYMTGCMNEFGAYDVNGNVWEIVPDDPAESPMGWTFQVRGGAFNCGGASTRLRCDYEANWTSLYAGFRCCKDPD